MKIPQPFKTELFALGLIILCALGVRFWHLESLPAALNRDEAALGYNAWLLQTTGKDEWGVEWPLALESFGDYKLPGYPWLTILSFIGFGRSDWSVRLPSALAGSLLPLAMWWLVKQLQWSKQSRLAVAALTAGLPFAIFYSRMAFEANVALTLVIISLGFLIHALQVKNNKWFALSSSITIFSWLLAVFTYNTPLLLTPFVIMGILVWLGKHDWRKAGLLSIGFALVMAIGFSQLLKLSQHKAGITIFSDPTVHSQIIDRYTSLSGLEQKIFGSKWWFYGTTISRNFAKSWSPNFLVIYGGSHPWHTIPGAAHLTWFVYIFGLVGTLKLVWMTVSDLKNHQPVFVSNCHSFLLWLMISALAPAIVTVDAPHATRSLLFMLLFGLAAVFGAQWLLKSVQQQGRLLKIKSLWLMIIFASFGSGRYLYRYFTQYPQTQGMFQPGLATVLPSLSQSQKPIIVAGDGYTYISLAWYQPISPVDFLATIERHPIDTIGFAAGKKVGNYTIRPDFKTPEAEQATLIEWKGDGWIVR